MRILHVCHTYFPDTQGGLEEVVRQICLNTNIHGAENRIFTLSRLADPQVIRRPEADVYRFKTAVRIASCGFSMSAVSGFKDLTDWADVVNYHFPWPFGDFLHWFWRVKKPSVVTYHSDIVRQKHLIKIYKPLMDFFLNKMEYCISTSPNYLASSETLGRLSEKVKVIPIGIDEKSYPIVDEAEVKSMKAALGEGFFLFIGVLRYYKGLHFLLEAIRGTDMRLVILGSGPMEKQLKEYAKKLGVKNNVFFLGKLDDKKKLALIKLSKAIILPSHLRSEAFGVTLLEGAIYGKPLISTEMNTGTSYINSHGKSGLVVSPADSGQLRKAMKQLDKNSNLAAHMGQMARKRYENLFTGRVMGERYAQLYDSLMTFGRKVS